jgi:hypothetical protein
VIVELQQDLDMWKVTRRLQGGIEEKEGRGKLE